MSIVRYQLPALSRWSSHDRFSSFRDEVNRLFDFTVPSREGRPSSGWNPPLDVFDNKDQLVVQVELPGVQKDAISLSLHEGVLTISGERPTDAKDQGAFRSERSSGKFSRSVTLPAAVDANKVNATYKDGILTVELAKAEEAKPKQISVTVS